MGRDEGKKGKVIYDGCAERGTPPFSLFSPVENFWILRVFEQELTEDVNGRDLRANHWRPSYSQCLDGVG